MAQHEYARAVKRGAKVAKSSHSRKNCSNWGTGLVRPVSEMKQDEFERI